MRRTYPEPAQVCRWRIQPQRHQDTKMHKGINGLRDLCDFVTSWLRPVWLRLFLVGGSQGTRWCLVASAAACARLAAPSFWRQALTWCRAVAVLITSFSPISSLLNP